MKLKEQIVQKLKEEAEFAKTTGMPQFVMGIQQASKVVENMEDVKINQKLTFSVLDDIANERINQYAKWGKQVHDYNTWLTILIEEVGEAAQAIQKGSIAYKSTDADNLYTELIQVAAVATAIAEQVLEKGEEYE